MDYVVIMNANNCLISEEEEQTILNKEPVTPKSLSPARNRVNIEATPTVMKVKPSLTEMKRKSINKISNTILKRKNQKQINEDLLLTKKLEILEFQRQQEELKVETSRVLLNKELEAKERSAKLQEIEIELKKVLLENAKLDLELKKKDLYL